LTRIRQPANYPPPVVRNLSEIYQYRALLWNLVQRELKARYRGSVLGFLWTFLNPTLLMLVYALLFTVYMRQNMEHYLLFMFIGILAWTWFGSSVAGGASAISDRRDLLTKVKFPAQVLPATLVVTNGINFLLSLPLMFALSFAYGVFPSWHLVFLPVIFTIQLALTLGLSYLVSALNVTFRDLQHIVSNLLTLGFFLTPILYPVSIIPERFQGLAVMLNPMAALITSYQDIFYYQRIPQAAPLAVAASVALVLLVGASVFFERRREDFAELI
jgi:lipopolysaccharide transport system permease protein